MSHLLFTYQLLIIENQPTVQKKKAKNWPTGQYPQLWLPPLPVPLVTLPQPFFSRKGKTEEAVAHSSFSSQGLLCQKPWHFLQVQKDLSVSAPNGETRLYHSWSRTQREKVFCTEGCLKHILGDLAVILLISLPSVLLCNSNSVTKDWGVGGVEVDKVGRKNLTHF